MNQLPQIVKESLGGLIRDFQLSVVAEKVGVTYAVCEIAGRNISLKFQIDVVDNWSDCRVVIDGKDAFDCAAVEELVLEKNDALTTLRKKQERYSKSRYPTLLAAAERHCDFITVFLWPLFAGDRPETPTYLLSPVAPYLDLKSQLIACWIKTNKETV